LQNNATNIKQYENNFKNYFNTLLKRNNNTIKKLLKVSYNFQDGLMLEEDININYSEYK